MQKLRMAAKSIKSISSSKSSRSSSSSSSRRMPTWLTTELAEDIERAGGIAKLKQEDKKQALSELLERLNKPECYGVKGSEQRRSISQKVARWKRRDPDQWLAKLKELGVQPAQKRETREVGIEERLQNLSITARTRHSEEEVSDLEDGEPPFKTRRSPAARREAPARQAPARQAPTIQRIVQEVQEELLDNQAMAERRAPRVINIDPSYPGNQGEGVYAFHITAVEYGGREWDGAILIELDQVDTRDVMDSCYKLEYLEGGNTATLTVPTLSSSYRHDKVEYELLQTQPHQRAFLKGQDMTRSTWEQLNPDQKVQKIKLQFPQGYKLCETPFLAAGGAGVRGPDGTVKAESKMLVYQKSCGFNYTVATHAQVGQPILDLHTRINWKLADSSQSRLLATQANQGVETATAAFRGL
jgi:hypothetical protein